MLMRSLRMMMMRPLFIDNPGRRRCGCRTGWDNCGYKERRILLIGGNKRYDTGRCFTTGYIP